MKKSERMEAIVSAMEAEAGMHPCYTGFFQCFNRTDYYEAHDVLEHLWLRTEGPEADYFKGLIQIAGGFVHMRQQYFRPHHHKYGKRLAPAARLLRLGAANIGPFAPHFMRFDVAAMLVLSDRFAAVIESGGFTRNPWRPEAAPQILLEPA